MMRRETQHFRRILWAVYLVDVAERSKGARAVEARQVALMALHDEAGFKKTHAEIELGMLSGFAGARRSLSRKLEVSAATRERVAAFYALLDANPMPRARARAGALG